MFRRPASGDRPPAPEPMLRVTSVLGPELQYQGRLTGRGGVRIEGAFEGEIALDGTLVVGETGRVTCETVRARTVVVAGTLHGNIVAEKVEIRRTGRVWGDVRTKSFVTEDGAFLRGSVQMEEDLDPGVSPSPEIPPGPEPRDAD